jgi:hypothetical protein
MKVFYMSRKLETGDGLCPDENKYLSRVDPFIRALERSEDCFYSMILQGKYLYSVFRHSGLNEEEADYAKWAAEAVFEYVRRREFPNSVSRLGCNVYYDAPEDARQIFRSLGEGSEKAVQMYLYEVELDEKRPTYYDRSIFRMAYEILGENQDLNKAIQTARRYFAGKRTSTPLLELLSEKQAIILTEAEELHQES